MKVRLGRCSHFGCQEFATHERITRGLVRLGYCHNHHVKAALLFGDGLSEEQFEARIRRAA